MELLFIAIVLLLIIGTLVGKSNTSISRGCSNSSSSQHEDESECGQSTDTLPYIKKNRLLSNAELSFYHTLNSLVGERMTVFSKVRIADILLTQKGLQAKARMSFFGKISQKHVDYVLTDSKTSQILAVVELDDSSHSSDKVQLRDKFVDDCFNSARLPLVRVPARRGYRQSELIPLFEAAGVGLGEIEPDNREVELPNDQNEKNSCPLCEGNLIERQGRGKRGTRFIGCDQYPKCKHTQPI